MLLGFERLLLKLNLSSILGTASLAVVALEAPFARVFLVRVRSEGAPVTDGKVRAELALK